MLFRFGTVRLSRPSIFENSKHSGRVGHIAKMIDREKVNKRFFDARFNGGASELLLPLRSFPTATIQVPQQATERRSNSDFVEIVQ
jgi:hypothetical protein